MPMSETTKPSGQPAPRKSASTICREALAAAAENGHDWEAVAPREAGAPYVVRIWETAGRPEGGAE